MGLSASLSVVFCEQRQYRVGFGRATTSRAPGKKGGIAVKQMILGTSVGKIALSLRDKIEVLFAVWFHPENAESILNEQLAVQLVTKMCQPGRCFIDAGAHIGSIVSAVIQHDPSIKIIAIEPIPEKGVKLRRKFPSVEVHECALGAKDGEVTFFVNTKQTGYSSLLRPANDRASNIIEIKVPMKKLDSLVSSRDVDVIKIDAEGAELGVLQGSIDLLQKSRPVIMFRTILSFEQEVNDAKGALWRLLAEQNYAVLVPSHVAHNDPGLSQNGFMESQVYPDRAKRFFAIPKERRNEIRERARKIQKLPAA